MQIADERFGMRVFTTTAGRITAGLWCGLGLAVIAQALRWAYHFS